MNFEIIIPDKIQPAAPGSFPTNYIINPISKKDTDVDMYTQYKNNVPGKNRVGIRLSTRSYKHGIQWNFAIFDLAASPGIKEAFLKIDYLFETADQKIPHIMVHANITPVVTYSFFKLLWTRSIYDLTHCLIAAYTTYFKEHEKARSRFDEKIQMQTEFAFHQLV